MNNCSSGIDYLGDGAGSCGPERSLVVALHSVCIVVNSIQMLYCAYVVKCEIAGWKAAESQKTSKSTQRWRLANLLVLLVTFVLVVILSGIKLANPDAVLGASVVLTVFYSIWVALFWCAAAMFLVLWIRSTIVPFRIAPGRRATLTSQTQSTKPSSPMPPGRRATLPQATKPPSPMSPERRATLSQATKPIILLPAPSSPNPSSRRNTLEVPIDAKSPSTPKADEWTRVNKIAIERQDSKRTSQPTFQSILKMAQLFLVMDAVVGSCSGLVYLAALRPGVNMAIVVMVHFSLIFLTGILNVPIVWIGGHRILRNMDFVIAHSAHADRTLAPKRHRFANYVHSVAVCALFCQWTQLGMMFSDAFRRHGTYMFVYVLLSMQAGASMGVYMLRAAQSSTPQTKAHVELPNSRLSPLPDV